MSSSSALTRFNDGKEPEALRTIGEVSKAFGIKQHILRYWEEQFPMLEPLKRSGGRRYYRVQDIELLDKIDKLINGDGYTLKGARKALKEGGSQTSEAKASLAGNTASAELLPQLKAIRESLWGALST